MNATKQFATFLLDGLFLGVRVSDVQEVVRYREATPVPVAPPMVEGVINLRGQIITAIDLRRKLGLSARAEGDLPMNVVVRVDGEAVSLLVDDIGDVVEIDDGMFERVPETLVGGLREFVRAVCKLEGRLLLLLDTGRAASLEPDPDLHSLEADF